MTVQKDDRRAELLEGLARTQERIAQATRNAGRVDEPTLIAVTKFFPVEDLITLVEAGASAVGENREQELVSKVEYLRQHRPEVLDAVAIHFIGQLQSKKAKRVGSVADVVQSVDRLKLLTPLAAAAQERSGALKVLIQVDLEQESHGRGGVQPQSLGELADAVEQNPSLTLAGIMAVAPLNEEPAAAFARLARIRESFLREHPEARLLSAGMSSDIEEAVAIGATHLRVGRAILGSRPAAG